MVFKNEDPGEPEEESFTNIVFGVSVAWFYSIEKPLLQKKSATTIIDYHLEEPLESET